jgi:hypothetical protein
MKLALKNVRLSFPKLFTAESMPNDPDSKPAFSANFLIDPKDEQVKLINMTIEQVAREEWGDEAPGKLKALRAADKVCLHDGDNKAEYDGYPGMLYISSRRRESQGRPGVFHRYIDQGTGKPQVLTEKDGIIYGGCFVNCSVDVYAQTKASGFGERIIATLRGVQFYKDGDAFGAAPASTADEYEGEEPEEASIA